MGAGTSDLPSTIHTLHTIHVAVVVPFSIVAALLLIAYVVALHFTVGSCALLSSGAFQVVVVGIKTDISVDGV